MDPNRIYTGGIFRLRRSDDHTLQIVMPEDAASFGLFWVRDLYPDGSVCFRPQHGRTTAQSTPVLLPGELVKELEEVQSESRLADIEEVLRFLLRRHRVHREGEGRAEAQESGTLTDCTLPRSP
jgi:hypothetical protein